MLGDMNSAIRIEQRLNQLFAGRRRRQGSTERVDGNSAKEMERQAVERLFADPHRGAEAAPLLGMESARQMEREAMKRLYGERSKAVTLVKPAPRG
jgi:hypothetical protein